MNQIVFAVLLVIFIIFLIYVNVCFTNNSCIFPCKFNYICCKKCKKNNDYEEL